MQGHGFLKGIELFLRTKSVVGPSISALTPISLAASGKPAWASCQYGTLMFAEMR